MTTTNDHKKWKSNLSKIRKARELKQVQLAERAGISQQLISFYETGARQPHGEHIFKLSDILQVRQEDIMAQEMSPRLLQELNDIRKKQIWKRNMENKFKESPMILTMEEKLLVQAFRLLPYDEKRDVYRHLTDRIFENQVQQDAGTKAP